MNHPACPFASLHDIEDAMADQHIQFDPRTFFDPRPYQNSVADPETPPKQRHKRCTWSDDDMIAAIHRVHDELNQTPTSGATGTYQKFRHPDEPGISTITHRFGTWGEALRRAGL